MFARLRPGATMEGAQAEMDLRNTAALSQLPSEIQTRRSNGGFRTRIVGFQEDLARNVRGWLLLLLAGATSSRSCARAPPRRRQAAADGRAAWWQLR